MDWFSYLVAGILVYVGVAIFILGIAFRIYQWFKVKRSSVKLGMFPKPKNRWARGFKLFKDTFFYPQVMGVDPVMWVFVLLLHIGGIAAFIGHLRLFNEFTFIANALGDEGMARFAAWSGGTIGIILLVSVTYLIMRRFKSPYKDLSIPEDYLLLVLVLVILLFGNHLRFFGDVHVADYREYIHSLLAFRPAFPEAIVESSTKWVLVSHVLTSNLLFIYFPFSKLIHSVGTFASNLVRSEV
ncbi:MAG: respiratory nitrate reductase subunit gamma [Dehalococcoidia bacterium]|nr:MAG: respiratory nitrate reductase subunit gamma [Dehalococcoidia bacterium]